MDLPLPVDTPVEQECGRCVACMTTCPTGAIVAPYVVDARRCISYLTIESDSAIPLELRRALGNRIYGCDDCQLICPWSRVAPLTEEADFSPRAHLHTPQLLTLWQWDEATFLRLTEGSPIRRIGHRRWLRNLAVALGNAPYQADIVLALQSRLGADELVDEHIQWALDEQWQKRSALAISVQPATEQNINASSVQTPQQRRLVRAIEKGLPRDA